MIARSFPPLKLLSTQGLVQILRSPWAIAISAILAIYVGTTYPNVAEATAPVGQLYLGLLKMCVFPVLLSAITASIGRLMGSPDAKRYVQRIVVVFPLGLLLVSGLAAVIAAIAGPGNDLSQETLSTLGVLVNQSGIDLEISLSEPTVEIVADSGMNTFVLSLVPENIFSALETAKQDAFSEQLKVSLGGHNRSFRFGRENNRSFRLGRENNRSFGRGFHRRDLRSFTTGKTGLLAPTGDNPERHPIRFESTRIQAKPRDRNGPASSGIRDRKRPT